MNGGFGLQVMLDFCVKQQLEVISALNASLCAVKCVDITAELSFFFKCTI